MIRLGYKYTALCCYFGMITQAIVNNLAPLLFIIFKDSFGVSDEQLGRLILFNFGTQIAADLIAAKYCDKIGFRASTVIAHVFCVLGLIGMCVLPKMFDSAYTGLCIAAVLYAIGGGIIEVVISPIIESLPGDQKTRAMSLAHSFYCWGQMAVVAFTTLAVWAFGKEIWWVFPLAWALIPALNLIACTKVPMMPTVSEEVRTPLKVLLKSKPFIIGMLMMICSGSSELSMSQWSSLFVEETLGVSKLMGDLLGPCMFALTMALGRVYFGINGDRLNLERMLMYSSAFCVACYLLAVFVPALTLLGCALCGLSVAIMWPGTLSNGARRFPLAGTAMFGLYAVCGDIGCSVGPWLAGLTSDLVKKSDRLIAIGQSIGWSQEAVGLRSGLMVASVFPLMLFVCAVVLLRDEKKKKLRN